MHLPLGGRVSQLSSVGRQRGSPEPYGVHFHVCLGTVRGRLGEQQAVAAVHRQKPGGPLVIQWGANDQRGCFVRPLVVAHE